MSAILEQVPLKPEQERVLSANERKYARIRILEREIRKQKALLTGELSDDEVEKVEATLEEEPIVDDVPKYLSVSEVAMITGLSPQMVRRNCASGKFDGYQPSGTNGVWFVKSDTFRNDPKVDWNEFIIKRNELFTQSKDVANSAMELQREDLEEKDLD